MRTIVHISDLHFGRTDCRLVEKLISLIQRMEVHLVAVSGDLTQRAKPSEFLEAREFLRVLPQPQIVIPGNHDIPLYDLYGRFVEGLRRFRRYITEDIDPFYADGELAVAGVNTARALAFKHGRVNHAAMSRLRERMREVPGEAVRILVVHHPVDLPHNSPQRPAGRALLATKVLKDCAIDVVLSGHLHQTHYAHPTERLQLGGHAALLIQAGTAVSTRGRGEANSFNVIRTSPREIMVEQHTWAEASQSFVVSRRESYGRSRPGIL